MKSEELSASIDGIQAEGEYKIFMRSFIGDLESPDSNQVITRVKKKTAVENDSKTGTSELSSTSESDYDHADKSGYLSSVDSKSKKDSSSNSESKTSPNSQNVSGLMNKSKNDTSESIEKRMNTSNNNVPKLSNISINVLEDKLNTVSSIISILEKVPKTSPIIVSRSPNENSMSPKRDKGLIHHLMKDKSFEHVIASPHHRPHDVATRLAKNGHSFLSEIEKKQLLTKASESSLDSLINVSNEIPYLFNTSITSTVSFDVQSLTDKNVSKSFDKLMQQITPLSQTKLVNASIISSPLNDEVRKQNKLLKRHTRSDATNKSVSHENLSDVVDNNCDSNVTNYPSSESKTISHTLLADFVNNVKFSNSEPNLSNNLNKTDSTTVNESLSSLLRHSISIHDETDPDIENNYHRFSQFEGNYDVNFQDMNQLN